MLKLSRVTLGISLLLTFMLTACDPAQLMIKPVAQVDSDSTFPLHNELIESVETLADGSTGTSLFQMPWDAAPDPDAAMVYFTADGPNGPGLYRVPATGGDVTVVHEGAPLVGPRGLAVAADGQTIYVADHMAQSAEMQGAVFAVSVTSGEASAIPATWGTAPVDADVVTRAANGSELLYISGKTPSDGLPAVMWLTVGGDELHIAYAGDPLMYPEGVAVAQDGVIYVADRTASAGQRADVLRIESTNIETIATDLRVDALIGVALTLDESALLVSSLDSLQGSAQVTLIELSTANMLIVNKGISGNFAAGGIHRAANHNIFAWAGSSNGGSVYRVKPKGGN